MKFPKEIAETPYEVVAFRVSHFHEDEEDDLPGTLLVELAGRLPGTEAELIVPFEMPVETAIHLADELLHQYRCVRYGPPDEEEDQDDA